MNYRNKFKRCTFTVPSAFFVDCEVFLAFGAVFEPISLPFLVNDFGAFTLPVLGAPLVVAGVFVDVWLACRAGIPCNYFLCYQLKN